MSIRPIAFHADDSIEVWHDERGHGGIVPEDGIRYGKRRVGIDANGNDILADDDRFIVLECPVPGCGSVSTHPVGGGADPEKVQRMFALKYRRGKPKDKQKWKDTKGQLRAAVEAMDGPGRFRLEDIPDDVADAEVELRWPVEGRDAIVPAPLEGDT